MRLLIRPPQGIANETMMSHHFQRLAINQPEILAQAATLFKDEETFESEDSLNCDAISILSI